MKINNHEIYGYAKNLLCIFDKKDLYIPVKANFIIQKNYKALAAAAEEIEKARLQVAQHYGSLNQEKNQYFIPSDKIAEANKEINDLLSIEQDLDIKMIHLEDLGNIELTAQQMQALMFMIEE